MNREENRYAPPASKVGEPEGIHEKTAEGDKSRLTKRKRGFWRAVFAGVISKIVVLFAAMILIDLFVRPLLFGHEYARSHSMGRSDFGSPDWWLLMLIAFISALACGNACVRWSRADSWSALGVLAVSSFLLSLAGPIFSVGRVPTELHHLAIFVLVAPVGICVGGYLQRLRESRSSVKSMS